MDYLDKKYESLSKAIKTFEYAVIDFKELSTVHGEKNERIIATYRDSLIQRFEYCTDMLWKYLKLYMEIKLKTAPEIAGPKSIIRQACNVRLITEAQAQELIRIVDYRNLTSHAYKEELALQLGNSLPATYDFIKTICEKLNPA